jgi:hypothetical protein
LSSEVIAFIGEKQPINLKIKGRRGFDQMKPDLMLHRYVNPLNGVVAIFMAQ